MFDVADFAVIFGRIVVAAARNPELETLLHDEFTSLKTRYEEWEQEKLSVFPAPNDSESSGK